MYTVLVPVDRNVERAKRQIDYVTSLPGAPEDVEAAVLFVKESDYRGAKPLEFEDVESATLVRDELQAAGIACEGYMRGGMIASNIIEEADEIDADDIVMAGRDRSGVAKVIMGSVSQDVVLSTKRPVTIVG